MFCRLFGELNWILTLLRLFKMDSGKKKFKEMPFVSDSYSLTFIFCSFEFIRFFFFKIKPLSRFRLYNSSCISEHVAKRICILYWVTQKVKSNCYFKLSEHYIPSCIFVIICLINHSCHYCLPLMGGKLLKKVDYGDI